MNGRLTQHKRYDRRRRNNVALIEPDAVTLLCGHTVVAHPIAILPSHRRLYACPTCGTLQKSKA